MRRHLNEQIPHVDATLRRLAQSEPTTQVKSPWGSPYPSLAYVGYTLPRRHYKVVANMLAHGGMCISPKGRGWNFNVDIMGALQNDIHRWALGTDGCARNVAILLDVSTRSLLNQLKHDVEQLPAQAILKIRARDAVSRTERRVSEECGALVKDLRVKVTKTYLKFTTEDNQYCPITSEMTPVYQMVLAIPNGADRQRKYANLMASCLDLHPMHQQTLSAIHGNKLRIELVRLWKQSCIAFATQVKSQFEDLARVTKDLLEDDSSTTPVHRELRTRLEMLLPQFCENLNDLQRMVGVDTEDSDDDEMEE